MSRRNNQAPSQQAVSNAGGGTGSQNSGTAGGGSTPGGGGGQKGKRVPGRDSRTNVVIDGAAEFREGEVYYRTVTRYDGLPDIPDATTVEVARPADLPAASSPPTGGAFRDRGERRKSGIENRRASTLPTISSDEDASLTNKAASTSGFGNLDSLKRRNVVLWPEWNDVDVSNEKWDVAHAKPGVKEKGSKALTVVTHYFDDPEGKCELPPSLKAAEWRRPLEFIFDKTPVVVDIESMNSLDLFTANEVVHESETMRWITTQISGLWKLSEIKSPEGAPPVPVIDPNNVHESMLTHSWRPWEHIYALAKQGKGGVATVNVPQFNSYGKYVVKLFFMGCWRKVIVDDLIPFDPNGHMLLPASAIQHEIWPMLLTKALLKVAALDYSAGGTTCEFGDFNVIHCLTGWLPEVVRLPPAEHYEEIWKLLKNSLPEFTLPEQPAEGGPENERRTSLDANAKDDKADKDRTDKQATDKTDKFGRESKKDTKGALDKKKKGEKDDNKLKMTIVEEASVPEHPEVVVFAVYHGVPKSPARITKKKEMADAFEALRQHGFSHCYPHPVLLTQTRSCPLVPPPPAEKIPAWKTVRPRKKPGDPDLPDQKDPAKPIQCVHVVSPFMNYKLPFEVPETTSNTGDLEEKTGEDQERQLNLNPVIVSEETVKLSMSTSSAATKSPLKSDEPVTPKLDAKRRKSKIGSEPAIKDSELTSSPKIAEKRQQSGRGSKKFSVSGVQKMSLSGLPDDNLGNSATLISSDAKKDETYEAGPTADDAQLNDVVKERITEDWLDFEVLCKSFKQLHIYHKPSTYSSNHRQSDLKPTQPTTAAPPKSDKTKSASNVTTVPEEKSPFYFFIDSLKPTEIVVSFSALCHWNEVALQRDDLAGAATNRTLQTKGGARDRVDRESRLGENFMTIPESGSVMYDQPSIISAVDIAPKEPLKPGVVVAEPYSWKSLSTGPPVLQIHTTGTRATAFCLPEGRHVLRFSVSAPLGYQLHLISTTNFVFGDEEKILMEQTKESLRFMDTAVRTMQLLGKCMTTFSEPPRHAEAQQEFSACHCPYTPDTVLTRSKHKQVLTEAIYACVKKVLTDAQLATPDMNFALRAFNYDCLTKNPLGLPYGAVSRPGRHSLDHIPHATGATATERAPSTPGKKAAAGQKKPTGPVEQTLSTDASKGLPKVSITAPPPSDSSNGGETAEAKADPWKNREITDIEINAATQIEALWRGFYIRKISLAKNPDSDLCLKVQEQLIKAWAVIEQNVESCGAIFLRTLFRLHPQILSKFSFCKDEWSRVTYVDYQGIYPEHPMNTWFVVFREVFHVIDEMLCVPRLNCSLSNCLLSVINNDTLEQVPRICAKVVPHVYMKNKRGYTVLVEAKSPSVAVTSGHWRMRLLGATSPLPAPVHNDICSSFNVLDIHDYYIPNEKDIILRYRVKVTEEHLATVKVSTSKTDVRFKLSIIDNDEEVASCEGRGLAILPAFVFLPDPPSEAEDPVLTLHRSTSRLSAKVSRGSRGSSATKIASAEKLERLSRRGSVSAENIPATETKPHKYFIQAVVLRKTWPLSRTQWSFVQQLKEKEIEDLKVFASETDGEKGLQPPPLAVVAPVESSLSPQRASVKAKDTKKGAKNVAKDKLPEPANNLFNSSMPNWTLAVVSDADAAENIDVKKDTERADEIRAMKLAWEEAEPGRAAKAKQSRLNYLKTHMVRCEAEELNTNTSGDSSTLNIVGSSVDLTLAASHSQTSLVAPSLVESNDDDSVLTNTPPPPPPKKTKEILLPIDLTPFLRKTTEVPRLLDDEEEQRQMEEKRAEIAAWRQTRADVLERREKELRQRNAFKKLTLQIYEDMQIKHDEERAVINECREAYRQRLLEDERQRQEQIAVAEAAIKAEQEKNNPSPRGQKAGGTKSPVGKKKK